MQLARKFSMCGKISQSHADRFFPKFIPIFLAFASCVMIFGKLLFGFILGNVASTLANAEIQRVKYEEKLGAIQVTKLSNQEAVNLLYFIP